MINARIKGQLVPLRFDLHAMELLDDRYGMDSQELIGRFQKKAGVKDLKMIFGAMANSARHYLKQKEDVDEREIDHLDIVEINELAQAIRAEMRRTMHVRGADGNEDGDRHLDVFDAEMSENERKNAEAGEGTA